MHATLENRKLVERVEAAIRAAIAEKRIVGTVLAVWRHGQPVYFRAHGMADREAGRKMDTDAIFRMASCTKPLVAATALAMVDKDLLGLDDEVSDHLPQFTSKNPDGTPARMLVRHLLTHTSGLSYDRALLEAVDASPGMTGPIISIAENMRRLGRMELKFAPGTGWLYSTATDALGGVVAAVDGGTLGEAVEKYVTGPLGMTDTRFAVADSSRLAAPYGDGTPEPVLMAEPHFVPARDGGEGTWFPPARIFNADAPQSGGAGMAGTVGDFAKFLETVRTGGGDILSKDIVAAAMQNQIGNLPRDPKDAGWRFGFFGAVLDDPEAGATPQARGTIGWGGIYGHTWFIDPAAGLSVASFSNTAIEGCNGPYRDEIRDAIYGAEG